MPPATETQLSDVFKLDEVVVYHVEQMEDASPLLITTVTEPWAYAVGFPRLGGFESTQGPFKITVHATVEDGVIGIGALNWNQRDFIAECLRGVGDRTFELTLESLEQVESLIVRNARSGHQKSKISIDSISVHPAPELPQPTSLKDVTTRPFTPNALRNDTFFTSFLTTEKCQLTCVMCHFNGPKAEKRAGRLDPLLVEKGLRELKPGQKAAFSSTGDFFMDPNWESYLRRAHELGLKPTILTHGQWFTEEIADRVLEAGVRLIEFSVDSIDEDQYRRIRRGGELQVVLDACQYLRKRKESYPDLRIHVNCILLKPNLGRQEEITNFWRGKVDQLFFNAEYHDIFDFRHISFIPPARVDCEINTYVLPSGHIAPCGAIIAYSHDNDVSWLPHLSRDTLSEAHKKLCDLYDDQSSPLGALCRNCDWWVVFAESEGRSPYRQAIPFEEQLVK